MGETRRPAPILLNYENAPVSIKTFNVSDIISDDEYYVLDSHLRPEGQRRVAEKLVQMIKEG